MMDTANYQIICSNEIGALTSILQNSLFQWDGDLFTRRTIVVSGPAMKRWLQVWLSDSLSVAAGLEIVTLENALRQLAQLAEFGGTPSRLQLSLAIQSKISNLLEKRCQLTETDRVFWQPVFNLFSDSEFPLRKSEERRLVALADRLAYLFSQYALYGNGFMDKLDAGWQKALWLNLFGSDRFFTPQDEENRFAESFASMPPQSRQMHLFALSFLSPQHHRLFKTAAHVMPVTVYQLSPCMTFWGDIRSDYETAAITRTLREKGVPLLQQEALEQLLGSSNSLLANFGRLGRQTALFLEEQTPQFREAYHQPKGISQEIQYQELIPEFLGSDDSCLTALRGIRADLLYMREVERAKPVLVSEGDLSVQIHETSNPLREVQVVYDRLMQIIEKGDRIQAGDILVMAPDISVYEPYIEMVFGAPESQLKARVLERPYATTEPLAADFLHLISLSQSRFEAQRVVEFFSRPSVRRRHSITQESILDLKRWARRRKVHWGMDLSHRNERLLDQGCLRGMANGESAGTWQDGMDRLLIDSVRAFESDDAFLAVASSATDGPCSDTLQCWLKLFSALREDIKPLVDGTRLKLEEWTDYLLSLSQGYLLGDGEETSALHNLFKRFKKGVTPLTQEACFSFVTIKEWLEKWLEKESNGSLASSMDEVRFAPLKPKWFSPARAVVLVGMDEQSFPKGETTVSENLMKGRHDCDYSPTRGDIDRYLFLETLLYAQDYFLLTFSSESSVGAVERGPSNLICEFRDYLERAFEHPLGKEVWWTKHPLHFFDAAAFDAASPLKRAYQKAHYRAAKAYYKTELAEPTPFISHISRNLESVEESRVVELKDLVQLAKHPIRAHFRQTLGLFFDREEDWGLSEEDDFSLSPLDYSRFRYALLVKPLDRVVGELRHEGLLPPGSFGKAAQLRLDQQARVWRANLKKMGVAPKDFFEMEFRTGCQKAERIDEHLWIAPALSVERTDGTKVAIVGRLSDLTPQGLWVPAKGHVADRVKYWPHYLLLTHLQPWIEGRLLLGDSGRWIESQDSSGLADFVDYSFEAKRQPSVLMPDWVEAILHDDVPALEKKIRDSLNGKSGFTDEVVRRGLGDEPKVDVAEMINQWRPWAERLFGPVGEKLGRKK